MNRLKTKVRLRNVSTKHVGRLVGALLSVFVLGCAGGVSKGVLHCLTMDEWAWAAEVDTQHDALAGMIGGPYEKFLDRYDYLDANCYGINAARGDPE